MGIQRVVLLARNGHEAAVLTPPARRALTGKLPKPAATAVIGPRNWSGYATPMYSEPAGISGNGERAGHPGQGELRRAAASRNPRLRLIAEYR